MECALIRPHFSCLFLLGGEEGEEKKDLLSFHQGGRGEKSSHQQQQQHHHLQCNHASSLAHLSSGNKGVRLFFFREGKGGSGSRRHLRGSDFKLTLLPLPF